MKKRILLALILTLSTCMVKSQINLVLNPSFEDHHGCIAGSKTIKYATYWSPIQDTVFSITDTVGPLDCTPEYCNTCIPFYAYNSVPLAYYYNHYPRTGDGMIHMATYYQDDYDTTGTFRRDYLQGRLSSQLIGGKQYGVGFYICLAQASGHANNNIGAYLDDGKIDTTSVLCGMPKTMYHPQVYDTTIWADTLHWKKIEGTFTANGTEKFITIGNFFDGAHTRAIVTHYWSWGISWSGSYILDDVSVIPCDKVPFAGHDTMIHPGDSVWLGPHEQALPYTWYKYGSTVAIDSGGGMWVKPLVTTTYVLEQKLCGVTKYDTVLVNVWPVSVVNYQSLMANVRVYPNPAINEVTIQNANGCEVVFYDMVGRSVLQIAINLDKQPIDISRLNNGVYLVRVVHAQTGEKVTQRFLKQ